MGLRISISLSYFLRIGDSLGKFVDAGFPLICPALNQTETRPHYNLDHGKVKLEYAPKNDLTSFAAKLFKAVSRGPEDYCYVGLEGNPLFTSRLQQLETRVKGTVPKPVRAVNFYTETVGVSADGPLFLYLDTENVGRNFWGSSVIREHKDVNRGNRTVKAPVMGLTLSTLLKCSVKKTKGAHAILKIDIEGAEFALLNEAIGTLCDFTKAGVQVDMLLEVHLEWVLGGRSPEHELFLNTTQQRLKDCNVHRGDMAHDS